MIPATNPMIIAPVSPSTEHTVDPDQVNSIGVHPPFCDWPRGASLDDHGPLCESVAALIDYYPDPHGELHEVSITRISSYLVGTYDAAVIRQHRAHTAIRLGIDTPSTGDPTTDAHGGLCLTSGQARQLAAVLIDQADRIDGIRPTH